FASAVASSQDLACRQHMRDLSGSRQGPFGRFESVAESRRNCWTSELQSAQERGPEGLFAKPLQAEWLGVRDPSSPFEPLAARFFSRQRGSWPCRTRLLPKAPLKAQTNVANERLLRTRFSG